MSLVTLNCESQYLNGNTTISVILPDRPKDQAAREFYESGRQYKVLWLLHGTFGDHSDWLRKSRIELYASEKDLAVVMPSALNSDYTNWDNCMMGYSMYDYFFEELMPLIYNWFPVSRLRKDNFIAGLSMGGAGTLIYVLNHPEKFAAAACLSYSPADLRKIDKNDMFFSQKRFTNVVNNCGGMAAYLKSHNNVWDKLAEIGHQKSLPKLYFTCGTDDFFFDRFIRFKEYLQKLGIAATFKEVESYGHEWRFWDLAIQDAIKFFGLKEGKVLS